MPRTLPAATVTAKNLLANTAPFIWLFECRIDEDNAIRVCQYTEDVSWNGDTYEAYPIRFDFLGASTDDQNHVANVTIGNADRQFLDYLNDNNGLVDKTVKVRWVSSDDLSTTDNVPEWHFEIADCQVTRQAIVWQLGPLDVFSRQCPHHFFNRDHCRWRFGSKQCAYDAERTGSLQSCEKTWKACVEHGDDEVAANLPRLHPAMWGGFRAIPQPRQ